MSELSRFVSENGLELKDCDTLLRMCGILTPVLANVFSRLAFGEEILFHRP